MDRTCRKEMRRPRIKSNSRRPNFRGKRTEMLNWQLSKKMLSCCYWQPVMGTQLLFSNSFRNTMAMRRIAALVSIVKVSFSLLVTAYTIVSGQSTVYIHVKYSAGTNFYLRVFGSLLSFLMYEHCMLLDMCSLPYCVHWAWLDFDKLLDWLIGLMNNKQVFIKGSQARLVIWRELKDTIQVREWKLAKILFFILKNTFFFFLKQCKSGV